MDCRKLAREDEPRTDRRDQREDKARQDFSRGKFHDARVERTEVHRRVGVRNKLLAREKENSDEDEREKNRAEFEFRRTLEFRFKGCGEFLGGERRVPVENVQRRDEENSVGDCYEKTGDAQEGFPAEARSAHDSQQNEEENETRFERTPVFRVLERGDDRGGHHEREKRKPEHRHARCSETFHAGDDGEPELEERGMRSHCIRKRDRAADKPESRHAAVLAEEKPEEREERKDDARAVACWHWTAASARAF